MCASMGLRRETSQTAISRSAIPPHAGAAPPFSRACGPRPPVSPTPEV
jgi:hypothetical protein